MVASWKRSDAEGADLAKMVGVPNPAPKEPDAAVPPRFVRHLKGAAHRRRGHETPWVAVVRVDGVDAIRDLWGDPATEEFLRSVSSVLRASLRESDKLSPVGRSEYGIILDAPSPERVTAGLRRMVHNVGELAGRDPRWSDGALRAGVTRLDVADPGAVLDRARRALDSAGDARVAMAADSD